MLKPLKKFNRIKDKENNLNQKHLTLLQCDVLFNLIKNNNFTYAIKK